ncbi:MAG: hypothetical protein Q8P73_00205 [bacterium]|nr:hypothetical protein [bacterium]
MEMNDDINEDGSQRRVIISAVVLAVVVAGVLWYLFVVAPDKSTEPTPTPDEGLIAQNQNQEQILETPVVEEPTATSIEAAVTPLPSIQGITNTGETGAQAINPTSPTGAADWIIPAVIMAVATGLYNLKKNFSRKF